MITKIVNSCIAIALVLLLSAPAWGTSGGLDKKGCHNSKKEGYHCHRAQSESTQDGKDQPPAKKEAHPPKE